MKIGEYFKGVKGMGILATADAKGVVDMAVFAKPHIIDDEHIAFITTEKLTHENLQSNPHAAYMFIEEEEKAKGVRLFLKKTKEEKEGAKIDEIRRKEYPELKGKEYLVYFHVEKNLPLIGAGNNP
jgi:hypothetical protein